LELAKILEDDAAENAISKAINDVNNRIAQGWWVGVYIYTGIMFQLHFELNHTMPCLQILSTACGINLACSVF